MSAPPYTDNVIHLHLPATPARQLVACHRLPAASGRRVYDLAAMAALLGLAGESLTRRRVIATLRLCCAHEGLPGPLTPRVWGRRLLRGPAAIGAHSLWDAATVDAWLARSPSPSAPASAAPPLPTAARDEMARRAVALGGGR